MTTIFLSETERHVRQAFRLVFNQRENLFVIGEADHTESLLAQVCIQPPDVILLDWMLPGLNPQRLLRAIRSHCPETKIIATSIRPEQKESALQAGADAFFLKNLSPDQFIAFFEEVISH